MLLPSRNVGLYIGQDYWDGLEGSRFTLFTAIRRGQNSTYLRLLSMDGSGPPAPLQQSTILRSPSTPLRISSSVCSTASAGEVDWIRGKRRHQMLVSKSWTGRLMYAGSHGCSCSSINLGLSYDMSTDRTSGAFLREPITHKARVIAQSTLQCSLRPSLGYVQCFALL